MQTVILYSGLARFTGAVRFAWASPSPRDTHRFILFLAQSESRADEAMAKREIALFGFSEIELGEGRMLDVDSLNAPSMAAFRQHYEGALAEGSSLVWYPHQEKA